MSVLRGHVYWVDLEPTAGSQQRGRRPCLILTVDPINAVRRTVGVIPLSSSPQVAEPIVVAVKSIGPQSVAICDQLRAVDKRKIDRLIGPVTNDELALIEASVKAVFGLQ
jgi:mRNA interferase MazF